MAPQAELQRKRNNRNINIPELPERLCDAKCFNPAFKFKHAHLLDYYNSMTNQMTDLRYITAKQLIKCLAPSCNPNNRLPLQTSQNKSNSLKGQHI